MCVSACVCPCVCPCESVYVVQCMYVCVHVHVCESNISKLDLAEHTVFCVLDRLQLLSSMEHCQFLHAVQSPEMGVGRAPVTPPWDISITEDWGAPAPPTYHRGLGQSSSPTHLREDWGRAPAPPTLERTGELQLHPLL